MWKSIKREISVNRDSLWQSGLILAGACLLGEVLAFVMMRIFSEEPAFIPFGAFDGDDGGCLRADFSRLLFFVRL